MRRDIFYILLVFVGHTFFVRLRIGVDAPDVLAAQRPCSVSQPSPPTQQQQQQRPKASPFIMLFSCHSWRSWRWWKFSWNITYHGNLQSNRGEMLLNRGEILFNRGEILIEQLIKTIRAALIRAWAALIERSPEFRAGSRSDHASSF